MIYIVITIILLVAIVVLLWYFLVKKKDQAIKPPVIDNQTTEPNPTMLYNIPQSSTYYPITIDEPAIVETEYQLLKMARAPVPHPQFVFNSRLRQEGNPFVGDLKIKPRMNGVSVPLIAEPSDLQIGYFK
jgi:hypothetical protein